MAADGNGVAQRSELVEEAGRQPLCLVLALDSLALLGLLRPLGWWWLVGVVAVDIGRGVGGRVLRVPWNLPREDLLDHLHGPQLDGGLDVRHACEEAAAGRQREPLQRVVAMVGGDANHRVVALVVVDPHDADLAIRRSGQQGLLVELDHGVHGQRVPLDPVLLVAEVAPEENGEDAGLGTAHHPLAALHDATGEQLVLLEVRHRDEALRPGFPHIVDRKGTLARGRADGPRIFAEGQVGDVVLALLPAHGRLLLPGVEDAEPPIVVAHCEELAAHGQHHVARAGHPGLPQLLPGLQVCDGCEAIRCGRRQASRRGTGLGAAAAAGGSAIRQKAGGPARVRVATQRPQRLRGAQIAVEAVQLHVAFDVAGHDDGVARVELDVEGVGRGSDGQRLRARQRQRRRRLRIRLRRRLHLQRWPRQLQLLHLHGAPAASRAPGGKGEESPRARTKL
mmetsp:Transcript_64605/g.178609  ORF Transcript_64605/g.178609 Transcript_64605/m.178609 type:complete len:451 (-) Transcript_64605:7-1359(-)